MIRPIAVSLAFIALAACAPSSHVEDTTPIVWPAPPEQARIAWVRQFSRPDDLGISRGFLSALRDLVFGGTEARLVRPMAVVEDRGVLFVADTGARGVHRFDPVAGRYDLVQLADGGVLPSPVGLARGARGEIFVTDSALGAVFTIEPGARTATRLALDVPLKQPTGIAVESASRRLFITDTAEHAVRVFDANGKLERTIGRRGTGDGEFNFPTLVWLGQDGRLYVSDALNFRTQTFTADGRFIAKFGRGGDSLGDMPRQKGIATDHEGHVYIADAVLHAVQIFDESGNFLLAVGRLGSERGEFRLPAGLFIADDDTIYVADSYNGRVQVLRYLGGVK